MRSWVKNVRFPLRATLVTSVVASAAVVIAMAVGIIGYPAYSNARESFRHLWEDLAKEVALTATEQVSNYFNNAPTILRFVNGLFQDEELKSGVDSLLDISYQALVENPEFVGVYYAAPDGSFYGSYKLKDEIEASYRKVESEGKTRIRNYRLGAGNKWVLKNEEMGDYDSRKRPFWKTGQDHPDGAWTDPYLFAVTGETGYSYVLGHEGTGGIEGYWVVDYQIDGLSGFLKSLQVGEKGLSAIVADNGTIIATSSSKSFSKEDIEKGWSQFIRTEEKSGLLNVKDRIYYVNRFPKQTKIPWNLITIIYEADYLSPIRAHTLHALYWGLIPCFIFLIVCGFFFGKVSRRLKNLAEEMDKAGNLSLEFEKEKSFSRILEVNMMEQSLHKMKVGLHSFAKYVPLDLVKKLVLSGVVPELGGEKKAISVLFADLAGFTSLSEKLRPDEIAKVLEDFLDMATQEVHKEMGTIDKFMGDSVMAIWGAPEPVVEHQIGACRAALALKRASKADPRLKFKIGINSGEAMVGNFGSHERINYTAIGDTVNIAARLEKINKQYDTQILIGPDTAKAVEKTLLVRPIDLVVLRGRAQSIVIYELVGDVDENIRRGMEVYAAGFNAYRNRRFSEAAGSFEKANSLLGGSDVPCKILLAKSRSFEKHPPPPNWNGTAIIEGIPLGPT